MTVIHRLRVLTVALIVLISVGVQGQDEPRTPLPIFASFIPNVQFAPLYMAIEEGLFAAQGYDAQIIHGDENVGVLQIAQGELPLGIISGEQVIMAREQGIPVVFVYAWFREYPQAVVTPNTVTMTEPADLEGLRVGIPGPFGANYTALTALLTLAELDESDIQLQSIGYVAPDVMCAGRIDAAVVYSNNEPLEIQRRIDAGECGDLTGITIMPLGDFVRMASNGLVINEDTAANSPELVRAAVAAFDEGARRSVANPARAYLHALNHVENLPQSDEFVAALEAAAETFDAQFLADPSAEALAATRAAVRAELGEQFDAATLAQFDVLLATVSLWGYPELGIIDPDAWLTTRDVMAQMDIIPADFDLTGAYTDEFMPQG